MSMCVRQGTSENYESNEILSNSSTSPSLGITNSVSSTGTSSPIKLVGPLGISPTDEKSQPQTLSPSESTFQFNEALTRAVESPRKAEEELDDTTVRRASVDEGMSTIIPDKPGTNEHETVDETEITLSIDDTMNDISAFSAIPDADLTRFAALRNAATSPTKMVIDASSPSKQFRNPTAVTPGTARRPLRLSTRSQSDNSFDTDVTPRRPFSTSSPEDLLSFTAQSNIFIPPPQSSCRPTVRRSPSGRGAFPIKVNTSPTHRSQASLDRERSRGVVSPAKQASTTPSADRRTNLLDFDLEPLATPRSIASITPRELESLRSELSSQISSLSATLSGKEAEVLALKRAITEAEVRVGKASEELRNERSLREVLEQEKRDWDQRGREMEHVLREIRQEIMIGEHERDKLRRQTEEAEKKTEEMEVRVVELQARLENSNRRTTLSPTSSPRKEDGASGVPATPLVNGNGVSGLDINEAVREATERVARDLHALYKTKHETKVAALKKSYEARWEKRVRHLEEDLRSANKEVECLKSEQEATTSGHISSLATVEQERQQSQQSLEEQIRISENLHMEREQLANEKRMLLAKVSGMESEVQCVKRETETLRNELEKERVEKGELVAQVDLFLALGDDQSSAPPAARDGLAGDARLRSVSSDSMSASSHSVLRGMDYHPSSPAMQQQQQQSPARPTVINGRAPGTGRPRPMSMLQPPGKFSGIPGPGGSRGPAKALPTRPGGSGGGGIMEGITKMGAGLGGRGY